MSLAERLPVGMALAAVVVYATTPYAIRVANRLQFYDQPIGYKGHARPTPYLGGAAVMGGFVIAVFVAAGDWSKTMPLVGGVALLWAVGTIDDRRTVRPGGGFWSSLPWPGWCGPRDWAGICTWAAPSICR